MEEIENAPKWLSAFRDWIMELQRTELFAVYDRIDCRDQEIHVLKQRLTALEGQKQKEIIP